MVVFPVVPLAVALVALVGEPPTEQISDGVVPVACRLAGKFSPILVNAVVELPLGLLIVMLIVEVSPMTTEAGANDLDTPSGASLVT